MSWLRANIYRVVVAAAAVLLIGSAFGLGSMPSQKSEPANGDAEVQCSSYNLLEPVDGGISHDVSNQLELATALKQAQPGDTVNLRSNVYDELTFRASYGHRSGTSSAPIVIQAAAGATPIIDPGSGSVSDRYAVAVFDLDHVLIRGLEIRHGVFGLLSSGATSVTFEHNNVHDVGLAGVVVNSSGDPKGLRPSRNVTIRCNRIHRTGRSQPEYGEGIYLGSGSTGVVDATSGVAIVGNEIFLTSNEAIDVKRHVTDVTIRHNRIHDISPYYGGAISLGLNKNSWGPANYLVEHNRIWSIRSGLYYAQAIAVAHGPTTIRHNVIWDVETSASETWPWTAPIQVHGDDTEADWAYGFGNPSATAVTISDNTVVGCTVACISSHTKPGQIRPDLTVSDNIVDKASDGDAANLSDEVISAADLIGPISGSADRGTGPGSGLELLPPDDRGVATTSPPPSTTTTEPAPTTTSSSTLKPSSGSDPEPEPKAAVESEIPLPAVPTASLVSTTQPPAPLDATPLDATTLDQSLDPVTPDPTTPTVNAAPATSRTAVGPSTSATVGAEGSGTNYSGASGPIIRSSARSSAKRPLESGRDGTGTIPYGQQIVIGSWYR